jgi:hypothetical protein
MTNQEIFDAWTPPAAIWSPWVKPVLFSQMDAFSPEANAPQETPQDVSWAADSNRAVAIVADLPGAQGVSLALHLATINYRPIPLYNACPGPADGTTVVDVRPIAAALAAAVSTLSGITLPDDAPPAFLLDANRNSAIARTPGRFDNRSISLPTDFPSAHLLLSRGIRRVLLVQEGREEPQADLSHTLYRWQEAGLKILALDVKNPAPPRPITVQRPKAFRLLWYNLLAKFGLKANPLGGFGGKLPMASGG